MSWWVAIAFANDVTLSLDRYRELSQLPSAELAPEPFVRRREVVIRPEGTDELRVDATFWVTVPRPGAVAFTVCGSEVRVRSFTVDGRAASLGGEDGGALFAGVLRGPTVLHLEGLVTRSDATELALLGAGTGELRLPEDLTLAGGLSVGPNRWVPGAPDRTLDRLTLVPPEGARSDRGQLVLGRVGYGFTCAEGEVRRAAHLQWRVVSGALTTVAFTVPGAGPDLTVSGPQVGEVVRMGDRVVVTLAGEERTLVDLEVRTSGTLPGGEQATVELGVPTLEGVFRSEAVVVIARDGELDLVPRVDGLGARSVAQLPALADGLVDGIPTAAFQGPAGQGRVDVYRFTPAEGPATLCDVASHTLALSDDGRGLLRAHYTLRNDRGHLLRVTAPHGYTPISAQVSGRPVTISRDGDAWLVPMDKSVESVEGLLTFPVEIAFLSETGAFAKRRVKRELPLPTIDAEVAVVRSTVYLPPGWGDHGKVGAGDRVEAFTEGAGITYGFAVGDVRAAQADVLWQAALSSWVGNDFDGAQAALDEITSLGGANANVAALQGNLDVINGKKAAAGGESAVDRRIKDQARARALEDFERQRALVEQADKAMAEGKYDEAESTYGQAAKVTEKLSKLANEEDVAQQVLLEETKAKLKRNDDALSAKTQYRSSAGTGEETTLAEDERELAEPAPEDFGVLGVLDGPWGSDTKGEAAAPVFLSGGEPPSPDSGVALDLDGAPDVVDGDLATVSPAAPPPSVNAPTPIVSGRVTVASDRTVMFLGEPPPPPAKAPQEEGRSGGRGHGAAAPSPAASSPDDDRRVRPAVVATTSSVVVPTGGEAVRFQHLLLGAGEVLALPVDAKLHRRSR